MERRVNQLGQREHRISISPEKRQAYLERQAGQGGFNLFGEQPSIAKVAKSAYYVTESRESPQIH